MPDHLPIFVQKEIHVYSAIAPKSYIGVVVSDVTANIACYILILEASQSYDQLFARTSVSRTRGRTSRAVDQRNGFRSAGTYHLDCMNTRATTRSCNMNLSPPRFRCRGRLKLNTV